MAISQTVGTETGRLAGKVALVTGGGKGLGASITQYLRSQGAALTLCGRDMAALESHAQEIDGGATGGPDSLTMSCDVLDEHSVRHMVDATVQRFGGIDILVNNAGGTGPIETPAQDYSLNEFQSILDLNVVGTFITCKAVIPHMIKRGAGRIVNIAGTSGLHGYANRIGYSASKWAVRGLTRTLALEVGKYDITVNTVCPNVTHGARMDKIVDAKALRLGKTPEQVYDDFVAETSLGRFIDDVDIAAAVSYLVGESGRNITGQDIVVDAGFRI
jgi:NAD(P)-dependent dehydrogenase (short-subunit alcohol dehydrogenase family)